LALRISPVAGEGDTRAAHADPHRPRPDLPLGLGHHVAHRLQARLVVRRRGDAHARLEPALGVQRRGLDLGPAEIHAEADHAPAYT
jgi:hypothetical protein